MARERDALRRLAEALPPGSSATVPRDWLLDLLRDPEDSADSFSVPLDGSYGDYLKARMERRGITQGELARTMRKSPTQVTRWFTQSEGRRVNPSLDTMRAIEVAIRRIEARKGSRD